MRILQAIPLHRAVTNIQQGIYNFHQNKLEEEVKDAKWLDAIRTTIPQWHMREPRPLLIFLFPSFLPYVLCVPTNPIWRKGTPFETMIGRTSPSSDSLLAEVFWGFPRL